MLSLVERLLLDDDLESTASSLSGVYEIEGREKNKGKEAKYIFFGYSFRCEHYTFSGNFKRGPSCHEARPDFIVTPFSGIVSDLSTTYFLLISETNPYFSISKSGGYGYFV